MENGTAIRVLRGAYATGTGTIEKPALEAEGFYWVWVDTWVTSMRGLTFSSKLKPVRVMLSEGQLEKVSKP